MNPLLIVIAALAPQDSSTLVLPSERAARAPAATPQDAATADVIVVHDVRDLTQQSEVDALERDIVSDAISVDARRVLLKRYRELLEEGGVRARLDDLIASVTELLEPPLVGPAQSIEVVGSGSLLVVGSPAQQKWIRQFLLERRRFRGGIEVASTIYLLPRGKLAQVTGGRTGVVLTAAEADALVAGIEGANVLNAPKVLTLPGQRASLSVVDQVAYVKDFELTLLPDRAQEILDPVIDTLQTGLTLDLRATPVAPDRFALRAELTLCDAKRPFPEKRLPLGVHGTEVTIQLPEVRTVKASGRFDLAPGSAVLIGGVDPTGVGAGVLSEGKDQRAGDILVVLKVTHVEDLPQDPK